MIFLLAAAFPNSLFAVGSRLVVDDKGTSLRTGQITMGFPRLA